ncbi:MAG: helix-turn-helix domain-containing protein [Faecousia sp.]
MNEMHDLEVMRRILLDCHSLRSWLLDETVNVVDSTCLSDLEKDQQHMVLQWGDVLRAHYAESKMPLILSNSVGMMWGAVWVANTDQICVMGPIFTQEMSTHTIDRLVDELDETEELKLGARRYLYRVTTVSSPVFMQLLAMLHYCANGVTVQFSDFVFHAEDMTMDKIRKKLEPDGNPQPVHSPLMNEKLLMEMVRTGNLDYSRALSVASAASSGIRTSSSDPIRQGKYSAVAFITLCSRAAIEGGLSSDVAYTLSDIYVQRIDICRTMGEIASVNHIMYEDYIRRVNQCRMSSGRSRPVQACCDYIDTHIAENLSVEFLAKRAGYADYYFSRLFKKETGISIKEYIRQVRLKEAKILLESTQMSIQEISEYLRFCSRSYFADQFQKSEGVTPADYRAKNANK